MASAQATSPRAHLLAGLRTGGVRSASGPLPHSAPIGAFNVANTPHYSPMPNEMAFPEERDDELADMVSQNSYINNTISRMQQQAPMTAAVDGGANRFAQQQGRGMNGSAPMSPYVSAQTQMQALQLQMMQMEIARLQAHQYQAELLAQAQAQAQQRQRQPQRRSTNGYAHPATAGPTTTAFDLRSSRANQADQFRAMFSGGNNDQVPMTAALGGRFGSRIQSGQYDSEEDDFSYMKTPVANHTSVISGGTALGGTGASPPSKSDAAVSWRRGSTNNSVLSGNRAVTSPVVKITPPPAERTSPAPPSPLKTRPPALQFSVAMSQPTDVVAVDASDFDGEDSSSVSSKSGSTPSTPRTASSLGDAPPLSPREEASKKLYEGLGIGRPVPTIAVTSAPPSVQRLMAMPVRQPRGPPSNNDELLPKNFATRNRRKAIGALGALMDARVSREVITPC
ncbi:hypothetical protein BC835DRAFT_568274 [Cytidiella melzeri]|nr:hypothetical protein BC835DRAFT_568274 [Cytidiella melzeri]